MDIEYCMLRGLDLKIDSNLQIKNPKLSEIYDIGYEKYSMYTSFITSSPYDLMVELKDIGIDYESLTHYQMFWNFYANQDIYKESFKYFTGQYYEIFKDESGNIVLVNENSIIDEFKFNEIIYFIKRINYLRLKPEYNPGNKTTLLYLMQQKRKRAKRRKKKEKINLESIISSVVWFSNNGTNLNNIWELTISQLYDGYFRLNKIDNYDKIMNALYAGTIEKSKIDLEEINWSSIINTDN